MLTRRHVLTALFLFVGFANFLRVGVALYVAPVLGDWALSLSLPLLGGLYFVWGSAFLLLAMLICFKRAQRWALPFAVAYQAAMWTVRLFAYRATYARSLWGRDLFLTVLFLGGIWIARTRLPI